MAVVDLFDNAPILNTELDISEIVEKTDEDIKNPQSAFALRQNEETVFDGCESRKYDYVIFQRNRNIINELCLDILDIINEFKYVTSRQIAVILNLRGKKVTQGEVQKKLKILTKGKVVARYYFKSDEGSSVMRVYTLDINGNRLLNDIGKTTGWNKGYLVKPVHTIKRILMRNQIIISFMLKAYRFKNYEIEPSFYSKKYKTKFNGDALITIENEKISYEFVFLVIRRYGNLEWQKQEGKTILLFKDYLENFKPTENKRIPPYLMICGEDMIHLKEINELITYNNIEYKYNDKSLYFYTYDNKLLEPTLQESFAKINNTEIKWQNITLFKMGE